MGLIQKMDTWLINQNRKAFSDSKSKLGQFFKSKLGINIISLVAILKCIQHGLHAQEHGHIILCVVYFIVGFVLLAANIWHIFFNKNIDGVEYRIKAVEIVLFIILSVLMVMDQFEHHEPPLKILFFSLVTLAMLVLFSLATRVQYLKYKGLIKH